MTTRIAFTAATGDHSQSIDVEESLEDVAEAFAAAGDRATLLTTTRGKKPVYVYQRAVSFWHEPGKATMKAL